MPRTRCKANIGRSVLKRARPTKYSTRTCKSRTSISNRSSVVFAVLHSSAPNDCLKSARNDDSENWYMWHTACNDLTRKNSLEPADAKGRYTSRCSSSLTEASALLTSASSISLDFSFVRDSESISDLFSRRLPSAVASACTVWEKQG